jgi:hypothetical protein
MRKIVLVVLFVSSLSYAQNKQILYDFAGLPQTLLLNPGAEVNNKFYVGVPLLSQISMQGSFSGFSAYDIFADDGIHINDKIRAAVNNFGNAEIAVFNEQIEVFSGGFKLKNNSYLSFGIYQELDFLAKVPKDVVDLFYEGNTNIGRRYSIKKLSARAEMLGVFHVGLSKKIDKKWTVGLRAKLYSGAFNANTKGNTGLLYTENGTTNIYNQYLSNINAQVQTSGVFIEDTEEIKPSDVTKRLFLGGNLGLGFDIGFTHHPKKQWTVTGSIQDIGFVYNTKNVESYSVKGSYRINGLQLNFDPNNPEDYWNNLKDDFDENVVLDTIYKKYISLRPIKMNGSVSYSFGQSYDDCRFLVDERQYQNKVGFHLFSTLGAVHSYLAGTFFYERRLTKKLQTKFTYTLDPFSYSNLGAGLAMQIGKVNTFFMADNLLNLNNVYNAKSVSLQLGLNIIFNN